MQKIWQPCSLRSRGRIFRTFASVVSCLQGMDVQISYFIMSEAVFNFFLHCGFLDSIVVYGGIHGLVQNKLKTMEKVK